MSRVKNLAIYVIRVRRSLLSSYGLHIEGQLLVPGVELDDPFATADMHYPPSCDIIIALPPRYGDKDYAGKIIRVTFMGEDAPSLNGGKSTLQNLEIWDTKTQHWILP